MYAGCPITWASKMEYLIELGNTESDWITLSTAIREVIGIFNLIGELKGNGFNLQTNNSKVTWHKFKDNQIFIGISTDREISRMYKSADNTEAIRC